MTIKAYSYFDGVLVTNTSHSITGNDVGDFADSVMGVAPYVTKTGSYSATESDEVIGVSGVALTITLPACASTRVGKRYTIRKVLENSSAVTIAPTGADTINGWAFIHLLRINHFVTVMNTGSGWIIIAGNGVMTGDFYVQTAAATVASSSSETTLISTGSGAVTLPANFFNVYTIVRVQARGYLSNTGTPTIRMKVKLGSSILADTFTVTTPSGLSNTGWELRATLVCRTTGATGTIIGEGLSNTGSSFFTMPSGAATTIDTTASQNLDLTVQWGTLSASNTITCQELILSLGR